MESYTMLSDSDQVRPTRNANDGGESKETDDDLAVVSVTTLSPHEVRGKLSLSTFADTNFKVG